MLCTNLEQEVSYETDMNLKGGWVTVSVLPVHLLFLSYVLSNLGQNLPL